MATVRKRRWTHNGVAKEAWIVDYTDQAGKRRIKTFEKKKDADRHRTTVEVEIDAGHHTAYRESVSVAEAGSTYIRHLDGKHHAKEITKHYVLFIQTALNRFIVPKLGKKRLCDLSHNDAQALIDEMKTTYSPRYVKQIHQAMSSLLKFGMRRRWVKRNVLLDERCELPQAEKRTAVPTKTDITKLLASLDQPMPGERLHVRVNRKLAVNLGIFCGLRPGEICALTWEDIEIGGGFPRLRDAIAALYPERPVALAQRGDIAVLESDKGDTLGVVWGEVVIRRVGDTLGQDPLALARVVYAID